jgi:hypothetical protein
MYNIKYLMIILYRGVIFNIMILKKKYKIDIDNVEDILIYICKNIGIYKMISQLYGYYSIIIKTSDKIYLCRDRMGIYPLYINNLLYSFTKLPNYNLVYNGITEINLIYNVPNEIYYYITPIYSTIASIINFKTLFNRIMNDLILINIKIAYIIKNKEISLIILNTLQIIKKEVYITDKIEDKYVYISDIGFENLFSINNYNDNYEELSYPCIFPFLDTNIVNFFITINTENKKKYFLNINV